jgi:hypothetical protein
VGSIPTRAILSMIEAQLFNAWGRRIDVQQLASVRSVILGPFPTWQYVIFRSLSTGVVIEMFVRL